MVPGGSGCSVVHLAGWNRRCFLNQEEDFNSLWFSISSFLGFRSTCCKQYQYYRPVTFAFHLQSSTEMLLVDGILLSNKASYESLFKKQKKVQAYNVINILPRDKKGMSKHIPLQ